MPTRTRLRRLAGCVICGLLATFLVTCDRFEGVYVRNDGTEPLTIAWQNSRGREVPLRSPLPPGKTVDAGYIGGPPDPAQDVIIKAFDPSGALVYCRRFAPSEYQLTSYGNPASLKPGELRCN